MDELLEQFLIEAPELAEQASENLLALERDPAARDRLDGAFRAIHTLKGSAALFEALAPMTRLMHVAEDVLGAVRTGTVSLGPDAVGVLLAAVAQTERWLAALAGNGGWPGGDDALVAALQEFLPGSEPAADIPATDADMAWLAPLLAQLEPGIAGPLLGIRYAPAAGAYLLGDDPLAIVRAVPGIVALIPGLRAPVADRAGHDPLACNLLITLLSTAPAEQVHAAFGFVTDQVRIVVAPPVAPQSGAGSGAELGAEPAAAATEAAPTLRIPAHRVDRLAALADDLVIAKNDLFDLATQGSEQMGGEEMGREAVLARLAALRARLDRLVGQVHEGVTGLRLVPLAPALRRLPRLVRTLAAELGKTVDFTVREAGVEADRNVVEALFDPLLHILRNAADHGIESAAARVVAGKPASGAIRLTARSDRDQLVIEVADDGAGIDPDRIRAIARARGLLGEAALAALDDAAAVDLVFMPGFSTVGTVTGISGRGVGMDAVRTAVARLGGSVGLTTAIGAGTTVRLSVPLRAALARLLVVASAGERFAVPIDRVAEMTRISADRIVPIRAGRAVAHRSTAVPLLDLGELLGRPACDWRQRAHDALLIATEAGLVGLRIDRFVRRIDAVVRPAGPLLMHMPGLAGTTVGEDGGVMLVLDPVELVR